MAKPISDQDDDAQIARRRDEVIKRMLNTPPQPRPQKPTKAGGKKRKGEKEPRSKPRS